MDEERSSISPEQRHARLGTAAALAVIVRGQSELVAEAPGFLALSLGSSENVLDDHAMLQHGRILYDALNAWCRTRAGGQGATV